MSRPTDSGTRSLQFRAAIAGFIEARREAKFKGHEGTAGTASKYEYAVWLADAARRVRQIEAVTHVHKATHPDAKGTSLHVAPQSLPAHREVGSHLLGEDFAEDVVGNAAALDVYKLLKLEVDGRRLLDWMREGDPDLRCALSEDAELADEWMGAFASLVRREPKIGSDTLAKQVFWLVGARADQDGDYHLLQPMFASSLAHAVHADIQEARFGDGNKAARQAFREKTKHPTSYRDYRNLVARKLGGTKPQNVSQLNSERGGVNYLLPSLPPEVRDERTLKVHTYESALLPFQWFEDVNNRVRALADFLRSIQNETSTVDRREDRDQQVQAIADLFATFGATVRARYPAGWTRDQGAKLPWCEQLWLDPERVDLPDREGGDDAQGREDDRAFREDYHRGDWCDQVATRFAQWLNQRLRERDLPLLAEAEVQHWAGKLVLDVAWPVPQRRRAVRGGA
jgi:CRISPR-associated protein Csy1